MFVHNLYIPIIGKSNEQTSAGGLGRAIRRASRDYGNREREYRRQSVSPSDTSIKRRLAIARRLHPNLYGRIRPSAD